MQYISCNVLILLKGHKDDPIGGRRKTKVSCMKVNQKANGVFATLAKMGLFDERPTLGLMREQQVDQWVVNNTKEKMHPS